MKLNLWNRDNVSPELKERVLCQGHGYAKDQDRWNILSAENELQKTGFPRTKEKTIPFSSRQSIGSYFGNTQNKMTRTISGQEPPMECSVGSGINDTTIKNPTKSTNDDRMAKSTFPPPPLPIKQTALNDVCKWWLKNKCTRGKRCRFLHSNVQNG